MWDKTARSLPFSGRNSCKNCRSSNETFCRLVRRSNHKACPCLKTPDVLKQQDSSSCVLMSGQMDGVSYNAPGLLSHGAANTDPLLPHETSGKPSQIFPQQRVSAHSPEIRTLTARIRSSILSSVKYGSSPPCSTKVRKP